MGSLNSKPNPDKYKTIKDLVRCIDSVIRSADLYGSNTAQYELNNHYDIPGLSDSDACLFVHSELVEIYRKKGFKKIALRRGIETTLFVIKWEYSLSADERKRRETILSGVMF